MHLFNCFECNEKKIGEVKDLQNKEEFLLKLVWKEEPHNKGWEQYE